MSKLEVFILNQTEHKIEGVEDFLQEIWAHLKLEEETEVSIVFCNNNFIRDLNKEFRSKDQSTDVLSFPSEMQFILGDVIISIEKAKDQATKGIEKEVAMLLCHGLLHLLGYDHEKSEEDYTIMMDLQALLLKKIQSAIIIN